nr:DNA polymerase domain-containing protein [Halorubellus salinus]
MSLTDAFSGGDDGDRPDEEARAVADDVSSEASVVDTDREGLPDADGYLDVAVTQVDYTIEGRGADEEPIIHVFGRRPDDQTAVHVKVYGFQPYFYAPVENVSDERIADFDGLTGYELEDEDGEPFESIRGDELARIFGRTPRDVGNVRDHFEHYEADILFPNRFLIDKDVKSGLRVPNAWSDDGSTIRVHHEDVAATEATVTPRVNTFDIEVDDRNGFPEDGEEEIVCLTSHDSYRDEYVCWLQVADETGATATTEDLDYDPIPDEMDYRVEVFEAEEAMLAAFLDYVTETDPDVMTGWNFEDFDAPYFLDRLDVLQSPAHDHDLDANRLSRVNEVWRSGWGGPDVKGRVVFDLLYAYKSRQFTELDSYRLDAVGETELDVGKERYSGDIGDLWEQEPKRLLEYNLRDVELCVELDRKQDIVAFYDEVRTFVGCKLEDAPTAGDTVDMYVLHKVHGEFALPSKGQQESEDYEGGAVFDPITGVKENVTVLDLKSLYPMCMVTVNASPETKVDPDAYDGDTYVAPNGTHFRKEPDGMIREMVDELLGERENKKALRNEHEPGTVEYETYDQQQAAVKVIMNCFSSDTDVLTPDGVRNIRDLEVGDEVYSLDPDSMEMEVKPVTETHEYPDYRDEMVDIETSKVDFSVTPNHRMLVRKDDTNGASWDDFQFVEAGDLNDSSHYELPHDWDGPDGDPLETVDLTELLDGDYEVWCDNDVHGHTLKAEVGYYPDKMQKQGEQGTGYVFDADEFEEHREYLDEHCSNFYVHAERGRKWIPRFYGGDDFLELLAWYVTEGNVYTSDDEQFGENFRGSATTVKIAQDAVETEAVADGGELDDHSAIGDLLDRMGFDAYVDDRGYQFTSKLLGDWLTTACGGDSFEKRIPEFVFELSQEQKQLFLDTLIAGDGDRQTNSWRYTTSSERLRDDVLRLCTHLGLTANVNRDSGSWRIYCTGGAKNSFRMHRSGGTSTAEDGAYCVTVEDNHTLLAGRNGKFQFVGQSLYGVLGWDRFRLYDKEMGAAVTATGRDVIEFTEESANELGHEVAYGDTDSVMIELGPDVSTEEAIETSFEIEEHINESYDDFAREKLNAEFHRFQIEFEKLYRRFFQAGKKKRYAGHIVWKEGKDVDDVDITGFEYKRSDIAAVTKEVQKDVIERIVYGEDLENIRSYVSGVIDEFLAGEYSYDEIAIPGGIGKKLDNYDTDTAQVRGAKYANLLFGTNFSSGSKPKRLYLESVHPSYFERVEEELGLDPRENPLYGEFKRDPDVICFEYDDQIPEEFSVDYEKMLDKTLKGPIARVIEALDMSWDEVKTGQEQTGLGSFM